MKLIPRRQPTSSASPIFGLLGLWMFSSSLLAVDGVIEINQARALAGGVTPGDAAGFPVTLSQPGSYRLTSNLAVDENTTAIEITSGHLSIDLNGFEISGPNTCSSSQALPITVSCTLTGTGIGISAANALDDISIRNGSIRGMGNRGISLQAGNQHLLENLNVSNNRDRGIGAGNGIYRGNKVTLNYGYGIVGDDGIYSDNFASYNGYDGINGRHAVFSGNTSTYNGASGIGGNGYGQYNNNVTNYNSGVGLNGQQGSYSYNTAMFNGGDGIFGSDGSYTGNTVGNNADQGIDARLGSYIGNTAFSNAKEGLVIATNAGYAQNALTDNNSGGAQVSGGIQMGINICHNAVCP